MSLPPSRHDPMKIHYNMGFVPSYLTRYTSKERASTNAIQRGRNFTRAKYLQRLHNIRNQTVRNRRHNVATASASSNFRLPPQHPRAVSVVPASESVSIHPRPPRGGYTRHKQRMQRKHRNYRK